jgi:competence protein ComEA
MKKLIIASILLSAGMAFGVFANPVNVNTADATTISKQLTDIGPVKAKAIVAYRKAHGDFQSVEDLESVKGIGKKTIEENRDDILLKNAKSK